MIIRNIKTKELFDCNYGCVSDRYFITRGSETIGTLGLCALKSIIEGKNENYMVEKGDLQIANDKGLLTEKKELELTQEEISLIYEDIFVDDEEFINSILEDERGDK